MDLSDEFFLSTNTKRKLSRAGTTKTKKTKMQTTEVQTKKLLRVAVSNTDCDRGSVISFMNDTDEEIDTTEIEEEEWSEHMKRCTAAAVEQMRIAKIPRWIETHKK